MRSFCLHRPTCGRVVHKSTPTTRHTEGLRSKKALLSIPELCSLMKGCASVVARVRKGESMIGPKRNNFGKIRNGTVEI